MEITPFIKDISENGVQIVSAAMILYIVWVGISLLKKWAENKITSEKQQQPILHSEGIKTRLRITPEVISILKELLLKLHATRVYVFEFHNGETSFGGIPFLKMSCTYEILSETAISQKESRQQMPFTLFGSFVTQLLDSDVITVDINTPTDNYERIIYETVAKRGTQLLIATKLQDENRRIIGYLGVDYCEKINDGLLKNDEKAINEIKKTVFQVAQTLSTLLYVKIQQEVNS